MHDDYTTQIDFSPLMEASKNGNVEIAELLLDNVADPNLINTVSVHRQSCEQLAISIIIIIGRLDCTNGSSKQWTIWHCGLTLAKRSHHRYAR